MAGKLNITYSAYRELELIPQTPLRAIGEAIIGLARGLGLKVVAEGVGTREQLEFLDMRGCDSFQGFWMSKPLPAGEFADFVAQKTVRKSENEKVKA